MFFFRRKFKKFLKKKLSVQVNESLGRLIVLWIALNFMKIKCRLVNCIQCEECDKLMFCNHKLSH